MVSTCGVHVNYICLFVTSSKVISGLQKSQKSEFQVFYQDHLTVPCHLAEARKRIKTRESPDATWRREKCIVKLIKPQGSHFVNTLPVQDCSETCLVIPGLWGRFSNYMNTCVSRKSSGFLHILSIRILLSISPTADVLRVTS